MHIMMLMLRVTHVGVHPRPLEVNFPLFSVMLFTLWGSGCKVRVCKRMGEMPQSHIHKLPRGEK